MCPSAPFSAQHLTDLVALRHALLTCYPELPACQSCCLHWPGLPEKRVNRTAGLLTGSGHYRNQFGLRHYCPLPAANISCAVVINDYLAAPVIHERPFSCKLDPLPDRLIVDIRALNLQFALRAGSAPDPR